jgi:hypothetical protein
VTSVGRKLGLHRAASIQLRIKALPDGLRPGRFGESDAKLPPPEKFEAAPTQKRDPKDIERPHQNWVAKAWSGHCVLLLGGERDHCSIRPAGEQRRQLLEARNRPRRCENPAADRAFCSRAGHVRSASKEGGDASCRVWPVCLQSGPFWIGQGWSVHFCRFPSTRF